FVASAIVLRLGLKRDWTTPNKPSGNQFADIDACEQDAAQTGTVRQRCRFALFVGAPVSCHPAGLAGPGEQTMQINEVSFGDAMPVDGYGPGFFRLGGEVLNGAILTSPLGTQSWGGFE